MLFSFYLISFEPIPSCPVTASKAFLLPTLALTTFPSNHIFIPHDRPLTFTQGSGFNVPGGADQCASECSGDDTCGGLYFRLPESTCVIKNRNIINAPAYPIAGNEDFPTGHFFRDLTCAQIDGNCESSRTSHLQEHSREQASRSVKRHET